MERWISFPHQNGGKILCYGNFECNADLDVQNRGIFKIAGDLNLKDIHSK